MSLIQSGFVAVFGKVFCSSGLWMVCNNPQNFPGGPDFMKDLDNDMPACSEGVSLPSKDPAIIHHYCLCLCLIEVFFYSWAQHCFFLPLTVPQSSSYANIPAPSRGYALFSKSKDGLFDFQVKASSSACCRFTETASKFKCHNLDHNQVFSPLIYK